jgi:hypothetical protein
VSSRDYTGPAQVPALGARLGAFTIIGLPRHEVPQHDVRCLPTTPHNEIPSVLELREACGIRERGTSGVSYGFRGVQFRYGRSVSTGA